MRIFVSRKPETVIKQVNRAMYDQYLGLLLTPKSRYLTAIDPIIWGMDNERFTCYNVKTGAWDESKWNRRAFLSLLESRADLPGCKFVASPDVIPNMAATLEQFDHWEPVIRSYGYPVGLVIQDGIDGHPVPWDRLDALFIGGTNRVKFGPVVRRLVREANRRGKWVHWGRAHNPSFIHYCKNIGCNSIDSSYYARYPDRLVEHLPNLFTSQPFLF